MSDDEFMQAFFADRLTSGDFDHRGHLRMAWLLLTRYPLDEAIELACDGIARIANRFGAPEKYNRTMSEALMRWMAAARARANSPTFDAFLKANPMLVENMRTLLGQYYSPERLASPIARRQFLPPDLQPLP